MKITLPSLKNKEELLIDILIWTPTLEHLSVGHPVKKSTSISSE